MNLTLAILLALSIIINAITIKILTKRNEKIEVQNERISDLDTLKEKYSVEMEKNKEIYSADRRAIIAENESYRVKIEDYERKLVSFSKEQSLYYSQMDNINNFAREMTPEEFLKIGSEVIKANSNIHDFTGIYILENKTHDKFYVGQSISVFKRAGNHFTGKGNKDIYEDYMRGDIWTVKLVALSESGFKSINALEKHFIEYHHSTYNGYNKTVGNAN